MTTQIPREYVDTDNSGEGEDIVEYPLVSTSAAAESDTQPIENVTPLTHEPSFKDRTEDIKPQV